MQSSVASSSTVKGVGSFSPRPALVADLVVVEPPHTAKENRGAGRLRRGAKAGARLPARAAREHAATRSAQGSRSHETDMHEKRGGDCSARGGRHGAGWRPLLRYIQGRMADRFDLYGDRVALTAVPWPVPTFADVLAARRRTLRFLRPTPLRSYPELDELIGAERPREAREPPADGRVQDPRRPQPRRPALG